MKGLARLFGLAKGSVASDAEQEAAPQPAALAASAAAAEPAADAAAENKGAVKFLPVEEIVPNPFQPRKTFNAEALQDLADSIREFGVIQPLLVRLGETGYELVAGERRLRASKLAGLAQVPVIVKALADKEMAEIAMIENLQREDLHFWEEAEGFAQLLQNFGFTQEELAKRMSKSQSTIANKLRLLKLSEAVRSRVFEAKLTERHARALLKLPEESLQLQAVQEISEKGLNVRAAEEMIQKLLEAIADAGKKKKKVVGLVRDVRIFLNTIDQLAQQMKGSGFKVKVKHEQSDDYITVQMVIPKHKK